MQTILPKFIVIMLWLVGERDCTNSAAGDEQLCAQLPVALALGDETQHLHLSLGQAVGIGWWFERPRLYLRLKGGYPLHQGTHAQLRGNAPRLVKQGGGLLSVARIVSLEQGVGIVVARPSRFWCVASLAAEGQGVLEVGNSMVQAVHGLPQESQQAVTAYREQQNDASM